MRKGALKHLQYTRYHINPNQHPCSNKCLSNFVILPFQNWKIPGIKSLNLDVYEPHQNPRVFHVIVIYSMDGKDPIHHHFYSYFVPFRLLMIGSASCDFQHCGNFVVIFRSAFSFRQGNERPHCWLYV